ncbi:unnamed protein product [Polarella glacialis]|uniref:Uncharacterized protein n=1 Tax=Polarella glacialis TaxID=89957 RepID=A0A813LLR7_POLGL|nr:unnamed protein product [Polarella glacialis]
MLLVLTTDAGAGSLATAAYRWSGIQGSLARDQGRLLFLSFPWLNIALRASVSAFRWVACESHAGGLEKNCNNNNSNNNTLIHGKQVLAGPGSDRFHRANADRSCLNKHITTNNQTTKQQQQQQQQPQQQPQQQQQPNNKNNKQQQQQQEWRMSKYTYRPA